MDHMKTPTKQKMTCSPCIQLKNSEIHELKGFCVLYILVIYVYGKIIHLKKIYAVPWYVCFHIYT